MMTHDDFEQYRMNKDAAIVPHVRRLLAEGKTPTEIGKQLRADGWQFGNVQYLIEQACKS
jgi:hypothetical protein